MITSRMGFLLCLVASVAAATTVWVMIGDRYTATMQFRVAAAPETLVFEGRSAAGRDDLEIYKKSQQQYVKSDFVLMAALRDAQVSRLPIVQKQVDPVPWLAKSIDVAFPGQAEVMIVRLTTDDPDASALLVAAVSKAYLDDVVNQERMRMTARHSQLEALLEQQEIIVTEKRRSLRELLRSLGTDDSQSRLNQQRMNLDQWDAFRSEWLRIKIEVMRLKTELELKKKRLRQVEEADGEAMHLPVSEQDLENAISSDLVSADLQSKARDMQKRIEELRSQDPENQVSDAEKRAVEELQMTEQLMSARQKELTRKLRRRALGLLEAAVSQLESELLTRTELEKRFAEDEAKYRQDAEKLADQSSTVENLKRDITQLEGLIGPMDRQMRELQVEMSRPARVTRITRIESDTMEMRTPDDKLTLQDLAKAITPRTPDRNWRVSKTIAAALACWLLVPSAFILFRCIGWLFSAAFSSRPHLPGPTPRITHNT